MPWTLPTLLTDTIEAWTSDLWLTVAFWSAIGILAWLASRRENKPPR